MIINIGLVGRQDPVDGRVVLVEADPAQVGDVLDGVDGHLTLQHPGELLHAGVGVKVPGHDVLQIKGDVVLQQDFLVLSRQRCEQELRSGELRHHHCDHADLRYDGRLLQRFLPQVIRDQVLSLDAVGI